MLDRGKAFIKKATKVHNGKYDYSLVDYVNSRKNVKIICPEHGEFEQTPSNHIQRGCPACNEVIRRKRLSMSQKTFLKRAKAIHGDLYDYSLVDYKNQYEKVKIICKKHGVFEQTPKVHFSGGHCLQCAREKNFENLTSDRETFIRKAREIHGDKYDYSKVKYVKSSVPVEIICKQHGSFWQTPNSHLVGKGCRKCYTSHAERTISQFLDSLQIKFEEEKCFPGLVYDKSLRFDFFVPELNLLIEYDGEQHFRPVCFGGMSKEKAFENFKNLQRRDKVKDSFALENGFNLIRISYKENLNTRLNQIFSQSLSVP